MIAVSSPTMPVLSPPPVKIIFGGGTGEVIRFTIVFSDHAEHQEKIGEIRRWSRFQGQGNPHYDGVPGTIGAGERQ